MRIICVLCMHVCICLLLSVHLMQGEGINALIKTRFCTSISNSQTVPSHPCVVKVAPLSVGDLPGGSLCCCFPERFVCHSAQIQYHPMQLT